MSAEIEVDETLPMELEGGNRSHCRGKLVIAAELIRLCDVRLSVPAKNIKSKMTKS
jgi:hypothetical protein